MPVAVVTDSTADLPFDWIQHYGIQVVPLWLHWEGQALRDGIDFTPQVLYARLRATKTLPTTSHPNPAEFASVFRSLVARGYDIYTLVLSARFSATYEAARAASSQFPLAKIVVEDSQTTSLALGYQVLAAARVAAQGGDLKAVQAAAAAMRARSGLLFTPQTLEYMYRSGRLGALQYRLAAGLRILPVLEIREGGPALVARLRTFARAWERMLDEVERRLAERPQPRLAVIHADATEWAERTRLALEERLHVANILIQPISPVVGVHTGPGLVGIAYAWGDEALTGPHAA